MKIHELMEGTKRVKTAFGYVEYDWKTDLLDEENEDYLPKGYDPKKVLELQVIQVKKGALGQGHGTELMHRFLECKEAQEAELIFLDLNPDMGYDDGRDEQETMDQLEKFYQKFGFRNRETMRRMWIVRKGKIPKNKLPE